MIVTIRDLEIYICTPYSTEPDEAYNQKLEVNEDGLIQFPSVPLSTAEIKRLLKAVNMEKVSTTLRRDL